MPIGPMLLVLFSSQFSLRQAGFEVGQQKKKCCKKQQVTKVLSLVTAKELRILPEG